MDAGRKIAVVTPTYNEIGTLEELVKKIFSLGIRGLGMVIVDDNSPDGTGELADRLAKKYPIAVIHRTKKMGLGTAYADAFKKILAMPDRPDFIMEIDADLSHDPAAIPQFLEKIKTCDIVLGSRYIEGGKTKNWDKIRQLVSEFGNFYCRIILNLPYRDITGGYKCYRAAALENIDLDALSSVGYNFQIETTYKAHKNGFKICEIPITFTERKAGKSKFNIIIIAESFIKVALLRINE